MRTTLQSTPTTPIILLVPTNNTCDQQAISHLYAADPPGSFRIKILYTRTVRIRIGARSQRNSIGRYMDLVLVPVAVPVVVLMVMVEVEVSIPMLTLTLTRSITLSPVPNKLHPSTRSPPWGSEHWDRVNRKLLMRILSVLWISSTLPRSPRNSPITLTPTLAVPPTVLTLNLPIATRLTHGHAG